DAEGLLDHSRSPGLKPETDGFPFRAHPLGHVGAGMLGTQERRKDLEDFCLVDGAVAKIRADGRGDRVAVFNEQTADGLQMVLALARRWIRAAPEGGALQLEEAVEFGDRVGDFGSGHVHSWFSVRLRESRRDRLTSPIRLIL